MRLVLVSSSVKRIATKISNCKIKWKKRFYFERLCLWYHTALNIVISPNFLVWKVCGKAQLSERFGQIVETVLFHKVFHIKKLGEITVFYPVPSVPARICLFNISNWSTRIRCENCSRLRMKTLERCQWCHYC